MTPADPGAGPGTEAPSAKRGGRKFHWPAAIAISFAIAAVASLLAFRWLLETPGRLLGGAARETRETASAAFHGLAAAGRAVASEVEKVLLVRPRVVVGDRVIVGQEARVAKLSLVEREFEITREMTHTFLHSTKRLELRGRFRATAGFDLDKGLTVISDPGRMRLVAPLPEILGVEMLDYVAVEDRDGLWNKITPEDRGRETRNLLAAAREKAGELGLPEAAEAELRRRLAEMRTAVPGNAVELEFLAAPAPAPDL